MRGVVVGRVPAPGLLSIVRMTISARRTSNVCPLTTADRCTYTIDISELVMVMLRNDTRAMLINTAWI